MPPDLKLLFGADDERIADADDILRPYQRLLPIMVEGQRVFLPEGNSLWRGLQFWGLMTGEISIDFGLYCIAGTCGNCKSRIRKPGSEERHSVLICQTPVQTGIEMVRLAPGFRFRKRDDRPWESATPEQLGAPAPGATV